MFLWPAVVREPEKKDETEKNDSKSLHIGWDVRADRKARRQEADRCADGEREAAGRNRLKTEGKEWLMAPEKLGGGGSVMGSDMQHQDQDCTSEMKDKEILMQAGRQVGEGSSIRRPGEAIVPPVTGLRTLSATT